MNRARWNAAQLLAAIAVLAAAWLHPAPASAVTRMHNNTINSLVDIYVYGVTNGHGAARKPWVAQFAAAQGDCLKLLVSEIPGNLQVRAIAGDGSIYTVQNNLWIVAPVTGWITVHVEILGDSEQRFKLSYTLLRPGADYCGAGDPPH